jgi:hypothetical protein
MISLLPSTKLGNALSVDTSIVDPHPFIIALLEGYTQRVKTLYTLPEIPNLPTGK